jgi:hypothetical protein
MAKHKDRQYCGKCHLTYVFQKVRINYLGGLINKMDCLSIELL